MGTTANLAFDRFRVTVDGRPELVLRTPTGQARVVPLTPEDTDALRTGLQRYSDSLLARDPEGVKRWAEGVPDEAWRAQLARMRGTTDQ